jgi:hypothetical protein
MPNRTWILVTAALLLIVLGTFTLAIYRFSHGGSFITSVGIEIIAMLPCLLLLGKMERSWNKDKHTPSV